MIRKILTAAVLLILARPAWSLEPSPMPISDDAMAVAQGGADFATDLYARLRSDKPTNLFVSPYSVSAALAMTYAGASGQTEAQIAKVLHFPAPEANVPAGFDALRKLLTGSGETAGRGTGGGQTGRGKTAGGATPGFQLRIANRLWGQNDFRFLPEFLRVTSADYGADLGLVDFKQAEAARKTINAWIEEQTENKIQDLLAPGSLDASTRLVLTNAIYFKARWAHEFEKHATATAAFHPAGSPAVEAPMMRQTRHLRYATTGDAQLLELPYAGDGSLSMLILLPTAIDGLAGLEERLTSDNLKKWSAGLESRPVEVHLPKFKIVSEFSMKDVLAAMGMPLAFSDKADFSKMSDEERLFISAVVHKAFVDVNEDGTEAAAATAVQMRAMAMPPSPEKPVVFRADHPFVFVIRDLRTQAILFMGRLANPKI